MTHPIPVKSLLDRIELTEKPRHGFVVVSPDLSFLLPHLNSLSSGSFKQISGLEQYQYLNIHTLTLGETKLLVAVSQNERNLKKRTVPVRIAQYFGLTRGLFFGTAKFTGMHDPGVVIVQDHINLLGDNPLIGPNEEEFGTRFPDMTDIYSAKIRESLTQTLVPENPMEGILVAHPAPEKLTDPERDALSKIGNIYFSEHLVPEAIVARHGGMEFGAVVWAGEKQGGFQETQVIRIFQRLIEEIF